MKKDVVICEFSFRAGLKQAVLGFTGGVGASIASIATAWLSEAPWLTHRLTQIMGWIVNWQVM